jgi:autotransporter-associated beta strand protein
MSLPRALLLAAATTLSASLEAISFDFTFSDVGATQTLTGTIDVSNVSSSPYANWSSSFNAGYFTANSLAMTLAGAPAGNGAYDLTALQYVYLSVPSDLDLSAELVGQYSASAYFTFGEQRVDGTGMFLLLANNPLGASQVRFSLNGGYANVQLKDVNYNSIGQTMWLTSFRPSGPATITTTINASDARVTGGSALQFQGGTFAPVGVGTLSLTNDITVLAGSTGTLDATGQNIVSTGAVTINGTSLTLTGSASSTIEFNNVTGTGGIINAGGVNTLSVSSNYTGATVVTGGKLIQVGTSQSASNQIDAGATLEFNVGAGTLSSGSTSFAGAGTLRKTGSGSLMWGVTSATFGFAHGALIHVLEGNLIGGSDWSEVWTNNHSDLRIDAGARFNGVEADVKVDRLLGAGTLSTGLNDARYHGFTIGVDNGDSLFTGTVVDSTPSLGDIGKLIKVGSGELALTGTNTYSGGTTLQAGALRAGNNAAFGSGTITLNAGVLSSDGTTARTLANAIVVGGNITLGDATKTGALTLSGAVDLGAGATLTTASNVTLGGAVTSTGALIKDGGATLKLATTSVVNATVVVSDGLLTNNGAINGVVSVTANGTLGGSGTISGAVTINGTLAPGNSPGLQTQVAGDTTQATGSHFVAQLGGTTPGNGDGFHDQYYVQAGRFILDPAVTLDVRSWVQADGLTTFVPARRDIFAVIRASNGIVGQFSDLTNADYAQWVIYENNTNPADQYGYLYGTGLNGDQTFAAYGSTPARAAIGASLWAAAITPSASSTQAHPGAFLDGSTTLGQVAIGLLTAVDADAYLAALSPEAYLAVGDYALTVSRSLTDAAFAQSSLIKTGAWTVGAGYNRAQHGYVGVGSPGYQLSGDTGLVTVAYDFGPHCSVGFFYGQNHGKTVAANAHVDYRGGIFGLTSVGRIPGAYPVTLKGAVVASELRFDATRVGPTDAGSAVSHHPLRSLGGQFTAAVELHKDGRLTVSPTLGFVQGRSTTAAFAEAGAGANLSVDAMAQDSSRLVAGLGLTYLASTDLVFDLSAAYEHEFASDAGVVSASFLDAAQTVPMTMDRAIADRDSTTFGLGASWKLDNSTTVRLGAEVRGNRELTKDYRYNASVNVRF